MITILHRLTGAVGRLLIAVGGLAVAFAGFQFWGTGLAEARAQEELDDQFMTQLAFVREGAEPDAGTDIEPPESSEPSEPPEPPRPTQSRGTANPAPMLDPAQIPDTGEAAGRIIIPTIGVDKTYVHGVGRDDLRKGPGHYPNTAFPGQPGNAAIAGHRTTYGAPFFDLDRLVPGDEIIVETLQGRFTYLVDGHEPGAGDGAPLGHFIVDPTATWVLDDHGDSRLTLTACHPKRSAAQRIVVTATLATRPAPPTSPDTLVEPAVPTPVPDLIPAPVTDEPIVADPQSLDEALGWQPEHWPATALWAVLSAVMAMTGRLLGHRWRRVPAYAITSLPFVVSLFICFTHLDKLLPAI